MAPRILRLGLVIWVAASFVASPVDAQQPRLPVTRLAADMVWVKKGPKLFGAIESRDAEGNVSLIVDRAWLKATDPEYYASVSSRVETDVDEARRELFKRIAAWRAERKEDVGVRVFLDKEQERLVKTEATPVSTADADRGLMMVNVLAEDIRSAYAQPPQRRKLMLAALKHEVERAISRTPQTLARELQSREVDWQNETPPMITTSSGGPDGPAEWAARVGMLEYRHRQSLNFQSAGSFIARTGKGADDVKTEELFLHVLQDQIREQVGRAIGGAINPMETNTWLKQAGAIASKEGYRGFRVARLKKDVAADRVTVTMGFYAQMPATDWRLVFQVQSVKSTADVKPESLEEVAGAEEVKRLVKLLGVALGGEGELKKALSFGAATKEAMNEAQLKFVTELNRFVKRVDEPPIHLPR